MFTASRLWFAVIIAPDLWLQILQLLSQHRVLLLQLLSLRNMPVLKLLPGYPDVDFTFTCLGVGFSVVFIQHYDRVSTLQLFMLQRIC